MGELTHFQINQDKTFQNIIVKHKVNKEVLPIQRELLLARDEREAMPKLQQEVLQMIDQRLLQFALMHISVRLNLQKLHHIRVFDNLLIFWLRLGGLYLSCNHRLVLTGQNALIVHGVDLSLQLANAPCRFRAFLGIKCSCFFIGNTHQKPVMRPAQFGTQCVSNWEYTIELPHISQALYAVALSKLGSQL